MSWGSQHADQHADQHGGIIVGAKCTYVYLRVPTCTYVCLHTSDEVWMRCGQPCRL